ncbi:MAG: GNAT family N-acetyltransferase [Pseudomonadota bacterium]
METNPTGRPDDLLIANRGGGARGACRVQKLRWDTDFFGFPCGRIENLAAAGDNQARFSVALDLARQALDWAETNRIRLLAVKIPGPDPLLVQALEAVGFYLTDNSLALAWSPPAPPTTAGLPPGFCLSDKNDQPDQDAAAFSQLFTDGRFHNDRRIPLDQADRLWRTAVLTQLRGEATQVLFLLNRGRPVGLTTVKTAAPPPAAPSTRTGCIFILGLHPEFRGRGLGRILLTETLKRAQDRYDRLEVETSVYNQPAVGLYQKCGFIMTGVNVSLHFWSDGKENQA